MATVDSDRDESTRRLLAYCVTRLASRQLTAQRLGTSVAVIESWMSGAEKMPNAAVLALADVIAGFDKT